jgi:hypothetical protein
VRRFEIFIAALILLVSLVRLPTIYVRESFTLLFQVASLLVLVYIIWKFVNYWIAIFLCWSCISSFYPYYTKDSYLSFQNVLYGVIWFSLLVMFFHKDNLKLILDVLCVVAILNVLFQVWQVWGLDFLWFSKEGGVNVLPVGFLTNTNEVSILLGLCFPAFLRRKWIWGIPLVVVGLVLAKSFVGILMVFGVIIGYLVYKRKNFKKGIPQLVILLLVGLISYGMYVKLPGIWQRLKIIQATIPLIQKRPWVGNGLGGWGKIIKAQRKFNTSMWGHIRSADGDVDWDYAHNEWWQMWVEFGAIGLLIIIGYLISLVKRFNDNNILFLLIVLATCLGMCCYFSMHIGVLAIISITALAMVEVDLKGRPV